MPQNLNAVEPYCKSKGISRAFLYGLWKKGEGPARIKIGNRTFITDKADAEWIARLEAEAAGERAA
jgi:predicted DNA-binding transcriptional regulator AlpA